MKRLFALLALLLLVPVAAALAVSGSNGHWAGSGERTVTVYDLSTSTGYDAAVRSAAASWSLSPYLNVVVVEGSGPCQSAPGGINFCAQYSPEFWSGVAEQSIDADGHYTAALSWANTGKIPNGTVDDGYQHLREAIACHELGHSLGITRHERGKKAGCVGGPSYITTPSAGDYALLEAIYSHTP